MSPVVKAALWMTGAIVSFSSMAVAGRELKGLHDTFEIMLFRSAIGLVIVLACAAAFRTLHQINRQQLGTHFIRNAAHFTGQNLWFYAVTVIPLAQVFALEFTSPIWVILLAPLLLGERLTAIRFLAVCLGFIGILIVTRPTMMGLNAGVLTAAASAIFFAITTLTTSKLTRTQTVTCILFYLTAIQLVFGLIATLYDGTLRLPDAQSLPWVTLIALAGLMAHFCVTNALKLAPAAIVAPMEFLRLPTIAVVAMIIYGEAIDIWVIIGAAVIFAGNYVNLWYTAPRR